MLKTGNTAPSQTEFNKLIGTMRKNNARTNCDFLQNIQNMVHTIRAKNSCEFEYVLHDNPPPVPQMEPFPLFFDVGMTVFFLLMMSDILEVIHIL